MTVEPLRSAMSVVQIEDTSLAVPSDDKLRTGQQRVLDQVHTLKRSKSKQSKNGSLSPSSPLTPTSLNESATFRFTPGTINGSAFSRSKSTVVGGHNKTMGQVKSRTLSAKSSRREVKSVSQWDQQFQSSHWPLPPQGGKFIINGGVKPSRSETSLALNGTGNGTMQKRATGQTSSSSFFMSSGGPTASIAKPSRANNSVHSMSSETAVNNQSSSMTSNQVTTTVTTSTTKQSRSQPIVMPTPTTPTPVQAETTQKISIVKTKSEVAGVNPLSNVPDITLKEAVEYLSKEEGNYQLWGASFIQHATFNQDKAKQEVLELGGIPPLVALLRHSNSQVQQTAAAALRNLVFKNPANKMEVNSCGGTDEALTLLKETNSTFTQKQLTGLLWNLSSADELKPSLIESALPVLTETIVVPHSSWSDTSVSNYGDPEVFHSATGCLRNLSCASVAERQAMRDCRGLIDAIISYVQSRVAVDTPDDMSVENCVCILHNLTYQLETEAPEQFTKYTEPEVRANAKKSAPVGCFSPKSKKITESSFSYPMSEASEPEGLGLLYHSKTMQTYLSLLGSSQKDATLEACCGALQNLTANHSSVSSAMSQTIADKLSGLQHISPLLQSPNRSLQKTAMSLMGNLSRTPSLHKSMVRQILPQLALLLTAGPKELCNCDDTIVTACNTARTLLMSDTEGAKKLLTTGLVDSLSSLIENQKFPKGSKAAALLLYTLWDDKDIQGHLKKQGMNKSTFVNEVTTEAHRSVQVID
ncbi:plakophilin-1 isoform X2 [Engraulis encrasicolus]|uniref:plakophilin-1 isoform X2 n=1 Tax=Engraulis encrasicolus TaxID=184585 RepID=UPI002FD6D408